MIAPMYELGLQANLIKPVGESSVFTDIQIEFNSDIAPDTILGNVILLEDKINIYHKKLNVTDNIDKFNIVDGVFEYKDRVITLKPGELNKNTTYVVLIKKESISSILGQKLLLESTFSFKTESDIKKIKLEVLLPKHGETLEDIPIINVTDTSSAWYQFQISRKPTFETIIFDKRASVPFIYTELIGLEEDVYYIRVLTEDGARSEQCQVFVEKNSRFNDEDNVADLLNKISKQDEANIIEIFPPNGASNVNLNTSSIFYKFKGRINIDDIDIDNTYLYISSTTNKDVDVDAQMQYNINVIYSINDDISYIIFTLGGEQHNE